MKNRILRIIVSCLSIALIVTGTFPALSLADVSLSDRKVVASGDKSLKQRIVVSMGDSYSSGEGIEPFYGNPDPDSKEFAEFLAHQSKNSWSGMLELPEAGKLKDHKARTFPDYSYDPNAKLQWYFVASSGAETIDILGDPENGGRGQKKEYSISKDSLGIKGEIHTTYFNPQISVLNYLNKQGVVPDYITLTLGGNDLGFVSVIETAVMKSSYINPNYIRKKLSEAKNKLDKVTRFKLNDVYHKINEAARIGDKQPCILVAGYPRLLDPNGRGLFVSYSEAIWINEKVDYFNGVIKEEVEKCKQDGINIEFIDVASSFGDKGAYAQNALINEVVAIPRKSDINKYIFKKIDGKYELDNAASARSMHPNLEGAKVYAECFQKVINHKEGLTKKPDFTPTPKPVEIKVLSDEQALKAIRNYILIELGYDQYNGTAPWYVDIDPKTSSDTAVIYFRAYTGAHIYYYVNRISGETHEKVFTPDMEVGVGEGKDGATFNAWDYLNKTPSETSAETTINNETSSSVSSSASNKPTVKVSNAVNKTYKSKTDSGSKYTWKIPKVTISGKNMDSVNKKIKKELSVKDSDVKYTYFIGDDIVSILVEIQDVVTDGAFFGYKVYNISIKSGKLMSGSSVVKLYKSSDSKFFKLVKKVYDKAWKDNSKKWDHGSQEKKWNKKAIKSYKYVFPYINKSGKLCFVAVIAGPPSDDEGWIKYDASKKKYLVDQEGVYKWRSV